MDRLVRRSRDTPRDGGADGFARRRHVRAPRPYSSDAIAGDVLRRLIRPECFRLLPDGRNPVAAPTGIARTRHLDAIPSTVSFDGDLPFHRSGCAAPKATHSNISRPTHKFWMSVRGCD